MVRSYEPDAYLKRKETSKWDFDYFNSKVDTHFLKAPFVNIKGDWDEGIKIINERQHFGLKNEAVEMQTFSGKKLEDRWDGARIDYDGLYPDLEKIVEILKIKNPRSNLHIQKPGQMHMMHIDLNNAGGTGWFKHLTEEEEKDKVVRVFVFLADWYPGQIVTIGNVDYTKWKKGDCAYFRWFDVPHGTANYGHHDRPMLFISGETTPEFEKILKDDNIKELKLV